MRTPVSSGLTVAHCGQGIAAVTRSALPRESLHQLPLVIDVATLADSLSAARQSENVSAAADAIDDVHEIACIELHIVGHNIRSANLLPINRGAARLGVGVDRRDVVSNLDRVDWVADVPDPHAGVEIGNEGQPAIVGRIEVFVRRMGTEPWTPRAKWRVARGVLDTQRRERPWLAVGRDVQQEAKMRCFLAE